MIGPLASCGPSRAKHDRLPRIELVQSNIRERARVWPDGTLCLLLAGPGATSPYVHGQREGCTAMLVLTRKPNQSIMIGDDIEVSVLSVVGEKVRIGIHAPHDVPVFRTEIYVEIQRDQNPAAASDDAVRAEVDDALGKLGEA